MVLTVSGCNFAIVRVKLSICWNAEMIHTAALASFKLLGDCDVSRQNLRIAAKVNQFILLRILGKITKPSELSSLTLAHAPADMPTPEQPSPIPTLEVPAPLRKPTTTFG